MNPVLSVRGLEKRFGAVVAADALTLDIAAGQKISLIGANGAGKTTFVNMVTGYLKPDSGTILLDGMDIGRRSPRSVARLGISRSFQIPQLFVELTAAENLTVAISGVGTRMSLRAPAEAQGRHDKAVELLERFGLADLADRPISELAGGVRKLIDIAMALVRRPKLLLLDEPTSGVSAEEKFATMDRVIHAVAPDAATIVFVEHDMEIVSRYADRVVAFYQGRILADGDARRRLEGSGSSPLRHRGRAMNAATPLLEIDNLVVEIQSMPALRGFSMHVARGAMVSLVGRNGAGKTTLMRSIMGHLKPAQGAVRFEGTRSVVPSAPCARGTRDRLHAGRSLPGAAIDGRGKHHAAVVGRGASRPQGPARLRL